MCNLKDYINPRWSIKTTIDEHGNSFNYQNIIKIDKSTYNGVHIY